MQFRTAGLALLGAMALPLSGTAQTEPAPPAITRTVIAAAKLPTVTDVPFYFKAVSITLHPDEMSSISAANGAAMLGVAAIVFILYVSFISGTGPMIVVYQIAVSGVPTAPAWYVIATSIAAAIGVLAARETARTALR